MQFLPIFAPLSTTANADQRAVANGAAMQHDLVAHRHVVADGQGHADVGVQHRQSWILLLRPMRITSVSPRTTAPNHTLAFSASSTAHHLGAVGHPGPPPAGALPSSS
jgi:hypothetical protein